MEKAAQKMLDSPAKQTAVGAIQEMGKLTPNQLDQFIRTFKSKFRAPIANRTWKFDLDRQLHRPGQVHCYTTTRHGKEVVGNDRQKEIVLHVCPPSLSMTKKGRAHTPGVVYGSSRGANFGCTNVCSFRSRHSRRTSAELVDVLLRKKGDYSNEQFLVLFSIAKTFLITDFLRQCHVVKWHDRLSSWR